MTDFCLTESGSANVLVGVGATSDEEAGRVAAAALWNSYDLARAEISERTTAAFAHAAVVELGRLWDEDAPPLLKQVVAGAEHSAEQLNLEAFDGLAEVVQNADDAGANLVRIGVLAADSGSTLLLSHNGRPVGLKDAVAMTYAYLSTKKDDPRAKGRFGIGLKTLARMGTVLTVHCDPYHFQIDRGAITPATLAAAIPILDSSSTETTLELQLKESTSTQDFQAWLEAKGAGWLVFLDSVRCIELVDLTTGKVTLEHRLRPSREHHFAISLGPDSVDVCRVKLTDPASRREWMRYTAEAPTPKDVGRAHKAAGATTPLGLAIPSDGSSDVYAGLSLGLSTGLPLLMNGQFDPDTGRRALQHTRWNERLLSLLADMVAGVAVAEISTRTRFAWALIPTVPEAAGCPDAWIRERAVELTLHVQGRLKAEAGLPMEADSVSLASLVYEAAPIDRLLDGADLERLANGKRALPYGVRDESGRWRRVLDDLGEGVCVSLEEGLAVLGWPQELLGPRDPSWFIRLAAAGITGGLEASLGSAAWIATESGRISPAACNTAVLLVTAASADTLGKLLGIERVIDSAFARRSSAARDVRGWLKAKGYLLATTTAAQALSVLARRRDHPIEVVDDVVTRLRDELEGVPAQEAEKLGPRIGAAVLLDGFKWENRRSASVKVKPAEAYIPSALEKRADRWGIASGRTPGLEWIDGRYERVLKTSRSGRGALSFLRLLGAEVAPRLQPRGPVETRFGVPASPIDRRHLPVVQQRQLGTLPFSRTTHIRDDYVSPDLDAVISSIASEKVSPARRRRARALLETLKRSWDRLYADRSTASVVYSQNNWQPAGLVTATWLAVAAGERWMSNRAGRRSAPSELAVRTANTQRVIGNQPKRFAYEVEAGDARDPVVLGLGLEGDARASSILDELQGIREDAGNGESVDPFHVSGLYAALASQCPRDPSPGAAVDDLTVAAVRAKFGIARSGAGLIYADGDWLPPGRVFRGRRIFGSRRAFVPQQSSADDLWRTLGVAAPSIADCVEVLAEIARDPVDKDDRTVLAELYRYLDSELERRHQPRILRQLHHAPLWIGHRWTRERPVYAVNDPGLRDDLGKRLPIWHPPCALSELSRALPGLAIRRINESDLTATGIDAASAILGQALRPRWTRAIEHLRGYLAENNARLYRALGIDWLNIGNANLAVSDQLGVELRLGHERYEARADAHMMSDPLSFFFSSEARIEEATNGGRLIASLFSVEEELRLLIALVWEKSWRESKQSGQLPALHLIEDEPVPDIAPDIGSASRARRTPAKSKARRHAAATPPAHSPMTSVEYRQLKPPGSGVARVEVSAGGGRGGMRIQKRRGLKTSPQQTTDEPRPVRVAAPCAYTERQLEDAAFLELQMHLRDALQTSLRDVRDERGIGADGIDEAGRHYEIKSSARDLPDSVDLTANEAEQALRLKANFTLAVVAGLEVGFETVIKLIPDPLHNLDWRPGTSVTLVGVRGKPSRVPLVVMDAVSAAIEKGPSGNRE